MKYLVLLVICCGTVFGEESVVPSWAVQGLGLFVTVLGGLVLWGLNKLISLVFKDKADQIKYASAIDALRHGVEVAQLEMVREIKTAAADGKLTREEIVRVEKVAYEQALLVAKGPALDLLKTWGLEKAVGYIRQIVDKRKDKDNAS